MTNSPEEEPVPADIKMKCEKCVCANCGDEMVASPTEEQSTVDAVEPNEEVHYPRFTSQDPPAGISNLSSTKPPQELPFRPKQPSSQANLRRIERIQNIVSQMGKHDIINLIRTDGPLKRTIQGVNSQSLNKQLVARQRSNENIDWVINALGDDEETWTELSKKHKGFHDFLTNFNRRKMDEKAGIIPKQKKKPNAYQLRKKQMKKELRAKKKLENLEEQGLDTQMSEENIEGQLSKKWEENSENGDFKWHDAQKAAVREQEDQQDYESFVPNVNEDKIMDWEDDYAHLFKAGE